MDIDDPLDPRERKGSLLEYKAIFMGAIGTLVDTSDIQRQAFNQAFADAGLGWHWDAVQYTAMLSIVGGAARIAHYAETQGAEVDAAALHAEKSRIYQETMARDGVRLRPGVSEMVAYAQANDMRLAWVTTTSRANIDAILEAAGNRLTADDFDLIVDRSMVGQGKPAPECYALALNHFALSAPDALAIEDTPESMIAARAAGLPCAAFPGAVPPGSSWDAAEVIVSDLRELIP